ncbi:MAG: Gfo/Idh/MocA family oxidoreductase [Acidobacteriota bacterium]|nr:Gfo/Idh/MocA family oxidoreductase [Acidobacteriota bacterium]
MSDLNRRDFLKLGGAAALGVGPAKAGRHIDENGRHMADEQAREGLLAAPPIELVRIGMVGIGLQGGSHLENFLKIPGCRITAVCDVRDERTTWASKAIVAAGHPQPAVYAKGPRDFKRLCETEELDLVFTSTPWEWHVPVMLAAMKAGKHAATEVPAAMTVDDCWALVESAEKHKRHAVMMENCNYDRPEMMVLNMVQQGVLGEVVHAEGGYLHDLRQIKFEKKDEGLWRRAWSRQLDGNLYPTHGLGPVANCLDINRGDRFDYMVSMSGPSRGLQDWAREHFPEGAPERSERFVQGDVNTSLIKTVRGKTIMVQHCVNLPRPYSRIHMVQGTKGMFQGYPNRVYIEGRGKPHQWIEAAAMRQEFDHPLWTAVESRAAGAGHGGMDFIEDHRLIHCLRNGLTTDMNVYDAAALSAVVGLSVDSTARRSRAVDFPDFTRGRWRSNPRLVISAD